MIAFKAKSLCALTVMSPSRSIRPYSLKKSLSSMFEYVPACSPTYVSKTASEMLPPRMFTVASWNRAWSIEPE